MELVGILNFFSPILNRVGYFPFHVLDFSTKSRAERVSLVGPGEGSVKPCYSKEWCEMQTNGGLMAKATSKCRTSNSMFVVHQE